MSGQVNTESMTGEQYLTEYAERLDKHEGAAEMVGMGEDELLAVEVLAHQLYLQGKYEEATNMLGGIVTMESKRYYPFLLLGDIAQKTGEEVEALQCFAAADALQPNNPNVLTKLGEAFLRTGQVARGVEALSRVLAMNLPEEDDNRRRALVLSKIAARGAA
jgi:predicted Zn-dependent protease